MNRADLVQSVDRALRLLDLVVEAAGGVTLRELSQSADLPRSTTHRLLQTLIYHGLVEQDGNTGSFRPSLKMFEMAHRIWNQLEIQTVARPAMEQLKTRTGLTVHLGILDDGQVVYIDKVLADDSIRMDSAVGKRVPVHCTALGKVLLAQLPEDEVRRIIEKHGLPRQTVNTITTWQELWDELEAVREEGYAIDDCELESLIRCVAAPLWDHRGEAAGAVSATGTVKSLTLDDARTISGVLMRSAEAISRAMGYIGSASSRSHGTSPG